MSIKDEIIQNVLATIDGIGLSIQQGKYPAYVPKDSRNCAPNVWGFATKGVQWDPAEWSNGDRANLKRWSRALAELEADGLVIKYAPQGRTSHVQPTPAGIAKALELVGDAANRECIKLALSVTSWATRAHLAALK